MRETRGREASAKGEHYHGITNGPVTARGTQGAQQSRLNHPPKRTEKNTRAHRTPLIVVENRVKGGGGPWAHAAQADNRRAEERRASFTLLGWSTEEREKQTQEPNSALHRHVQPLISKPTSGGSGGTSSAHKPGVGEGVLRYRGRHAICWNPLLSPGGVR